MWLSHTCIYVKFCKDAEKTNASLALGGEGALAAFPSYFEGGCDRHF